MGDLFDDSIGDAVDAEARLRTLGIEPGQHHRGLAWKPPESSRCQLSVLSREGAVSHRELDEEESLQGVAATIGRYIPFCSENKATEPVVHEWADCGSRGVAVGFTGRRVNKKRRDEAKINQDAFLTVTDETSGAHLLAVLDGHGQYGHCWAQLLAESLPAALFAHADLGSDPASALQSVVSEHEQALADRKVLPWFCVGKPNSKDVESKKWGVSGTTCVGVLSHEGRLWAFNVGDSGAMLIQDDECWRTAPHDTPAGSRVYVVKPDGKLAWSLGMKRVIGDSRYKQSAGDGERVVLGVKTEQGLEVLEEECAVTSELEVAEWTRGWSPSAVLVVASDGLWQIVDQSSELLEEMQEPRRRKALQQLGCEGMPEYSLALELLGQEHWTGNARLVQFIRTRMGQGQSLVETAQELVLAVDFLHWFSSGGFLPTRQDDWVRDDITVMLAQPSV